MLKLHAKDYYLAGIYPAFFAAGAIAWERRFAASRAVQRNRIIAFPLFEAALLLTTLLILPMSSPILKPESWVRYTTAMHLQHTDTENQKASILPQFYADRFGWQDMTAQFLTAYHSLSPEDRAHVCIWTNNYGEAGALDLLARKADPTFPPAMSSHNNYWIWGTHGCDFDLVLGITDATLADLQARYESVQIVGRLDNPYIMPYEHKNIYLLRHRKPSMPVHWDEWKSYI